MSTAISYWEMAGERSWQLGLQRQTVWSKEERGARGAQQLGVVATFQSRDPSPGVLGQQGLGYQCHWDSVTVNPPSSALLRMLCVNLAFNAMLPCVDSHVSLAGTPAILSMVTWEDGSKFLQLPSPFSRRGNPGPPSSLLSQSGSWGALGLMMHSHPAFQAAAVSPPSSPTCTALLPSCGTQRSLDWHWPPRRWASFTPQPSPREEPPALALGHGVIHFAFYTYGPLLSPVPSPLWRKSKPHLGFLFVCCVYQIPSFLPTPNLPAGTKSLSPWTVILISRSTGTDPSVTSQSSLFLLSLPCGATLLCVHVCCVQTPLQNFVPNPSVQLSRFKEIQGRAISGITHPVWYKKMRLHALTNQLHVSMA